MERENARCGTVPENMGERIPRDDGAMLPAMRQER